MANHYIKVQAMYSKYCECLELLKAAVILLSQMFPSNGSVHHATVVQEAHRVLILYVPWSATVESAGSGRRRPVTATHHVEKLRKEAAFVAGALRGVFRVIVRIHRRPSSVGSRVMVVVAGL